MNEKSDLEMLRDEINKVTVEIIRLTGERLSLAKKIGEIKHQRNLQIEDLKVERELKRLIIKKCKTYNVDTGFALSLLSLLIGEAKRVQIETLNTKRARTKNQT